MTPGGGHGSVHIWKRSGAGRLNMCARPDTVFGVRCNHNDFPDSICANEYRRRSGGRELELTSTIGENVVELLTHHKGWVLLCGNISASGRFLAQHGLQVIGMVRDPVDAYVSLCHHRHPELPRKNFGCEFDALPAVEWYGRFWSRVVDDLYESDSPILRYSHLTDDLDALVRFSRDDHAAGLLRCLNGTWKPQPTGCNRHELPQKLVDRMRTLTERAAARIW